MNKFLTRIGTVLLVPALLSEPLLSASFGFGPFPARSTINNRVKERLNQEAVTASLLSDQHGQERRFTNHPILGRLLPESCTGLIQFFFASTEGHASAGFTPPKILMQVFAVHRPAMGKQSERAGILAGADITSENVALSGDGKRLASVAVIKSNASSSYFGETIIELRNTVNGQPELPLRIPENLGPLGVVKGIVFSEDGTHLAAWNAHAVFIWTITSQELLSHRTSHNQYEAVAFGPDNQTLAISSQDPLFLPRRHIIELWGLGGESFEPMLSKASWGSSPLFRFTPDGQWLVVADEGKVHLWSLVPRIRSLEISTEYANITGLAISPDGRKVAIVGSLKKPLDNPSFGCVSLWNVEDGRQIGAPVHSRSPNPTMLNFGPEGTSLIWMNRWGAHAELEQWTFEEAEPQAIELSLRDLHQVAHNPSGRIFAVTGDDEHLQIWGPHLDDLALAAVVPNLRAIAQARPPRTARSYSEIDFIPGDGNLSQNLGIGPGSRVFVIDSDSGYWLKSLQIPNGSVSGEIRPAQISAGSAKVKTIDKLDPLLAPERGRQYDWTCVFGDAALDSEWPLILLRALTNEEGLMWITGKTDPDMAALFASFAAIYEIPVKPVASGIHVSGLFGQQFLQQRVMSAGVLRILTTDYARQRAILDLAVLEAVQDFSGTGRDQFYTHIKNRLATRPLEITEEGIHDSLERLTRMSALNLAPLPSARPLERATDLSGAEDIHDVPQAGAFGLWKQFAKTRIWSLKRIGRVEAGILSVLALVVLALLMPAGVLSQAWQLIPAGWRNNIFMLLSLALTRLAYRPLEWIHERGGAVQRDGSVIRMVRRQRPGGKTEEWNEIRFLPQAGRPVEKVPVDRSVFGRAAWTAWSSFVSVPFIAGGLLLGGWGLLLIPLGISAGIWTHGELNRQVEEDSMQSLRKRITFACMLVTLPLIGFFPGGAGGSPSAQEAPTFQLTQLGLNPDGARLVHQNPRSSIWVTADGHHIVKLFFSRVGERFERYQKELLWWTKYNPYKSVRLTSRDDLHAVVLPNFSNDASRLLIDAIRDCKTLEELELLIDSFGVSLAFLHRQWTFDNYESLLDVPPRGQPYVDYRLDRVRDLTRRLYEAGFNPPPAEAFRSWHEHAQSEKPYVLCHGDFSPWNIFNDSNGKIVTAIDGESITSAPASRDVAISMLSLIHAAKVSSVLQENLPSLERRFVQAYRRAAGSAWEDSALPFNMAARLVADAWYEYSVHADSIKAESCLVLAHDILSIRHPNAENMIRTESVEFAYRAPDGSRAHHLAVVGDFSDWGERAIPMAFDERSFSYRTTFPLPIGVYRYKIVVDGAYQTDPQNAVQDQEGNSVLKVEANQRALQTRLEKIQEQGKTPLMSFDMDDTLIPYGVPASEKDLSVLVGLLESGCKVAFNTLANNEWFYYRVLGGLVEKLQRDGKVHLLSGVSLILRREDQCHEVYVYESSQGGWRLLKHYDGGSKAAGLAELLKYYQDRVGLLAAYGDQFEHDWNDGSLKGQEEIPLVINVGKSVPVPAGDSRFINSTRKGPAATMEDILYVTELLSGKIHPTPSGHGDLPTPEPFIQWSPGQSHELFPTEAAHVEIVATQPGFVWAGIAERDSSTAEWEPVYLLPLVPTNEGRYRATLPQEANTFTTFSVDPVRPAGQWQHQNIYVHRTPSGPRTAIPLPLAKAS